MHKDPSESPNLSLKALLALLAAGAVALGVALPTPHKNDPEAKSQFTTLELGHG